MFVAQITFQNPNLNLVDTAIAVIVSLAASIIVYLMYHLFYGSRTVGAGVDRVFMVGGPAITALFLGIQSSIPLSLGLLGALSFVRFRTPVKDSAEIGFLLLLIASSIGIATGTYPIVIILFVIVFLSLSCQWFVRNHFSFRRFANLMISMEKDVFSNREEQLNRFLADSLVDLNMKTMSVMDGRVSLHYQFRKKSDFDKSAFIRKLHSISEPGKVEIFFGSAV
jgi:hypothetical protein